MGVGLGRKVRAVATGESVDVPAELIAALVPGASS